MKWLEIVNRREGEALTPVQRGARPVGFEILEILSAAWRQVGREIRRGGVVFQMAPGIGGNVRQSVGKAPVELQSESMIAGGRLRSITHNVRLRTIYGEIIGMFRRGSARYDIRLHLSQSRSQRSESGGTRQRNSCELDETSEAYRLGF